MWVSVWGFALYTDWDVEGDCTWKNWGSCAPLATLSLCALSWEEASGVRELGGVRVGWPGQKAPGSLDLGQSVAASQAGALRTASAWQTSLPVSPDSREREVWGKHGTS